MMPSVAINGFGRIRQAVFKILVESSGSKHVGVDCVRAVLSDAYTREHEVVADLARMAGHAILEVYASEVSMCDTRDRMIR